MIIILLFLLYPVIIVTVGLVLNNAGLIPGTTNYNILQKSRDNELQIQQARSAAITAKYRNTEDQHITKMLEAKKNEISV